MIPLLTGLNVEQLLSAGAAGTIQHFEKRRGQFLLEDPCDGIVTSG